MHDPKPLQFFIKVCNNEYDGCLSYRVMEAIRNFHQHRDIVIQGLYFHGTKDITSNQSKHTTKLQIDVNQLAQDPKFKPDVAKELQGIGSVMDLIPLIREYVAALGRIHENIRDRVAPTIQTWDDLMTDAVERGRTAFGDALGLYLDKFENSEPIGDGEALFLDQIERRQLLEKRSCFAKYMSEQYVSGESGH